MKKYPIFTFFILLFSFSWWLMWHTFSYDSKTESLLISDKVWSDFGSHLPLIRSFSFGQNWPLENPVFPGEKIRYHFLFYLIVGLLEKVGLRIDWAMNIPSILGLWLLLIMIFFLAKKFFIKTSVGLLAVILFLFNGSLSGFDFLKNNKFLDIFTNSHYPAFGPWNGNDIAAIWNLNAYTNQRHLGLSLGLGLLILYLHKKHSLILGILLGILLFTNQAIFAGIIIFLVWDFILNKDNRFNLIKIGVIFFPFLIWAQHLVNIVGHVFFKPGFLIPYTLTWPNFVWYWWRNLGLHLFLIPLGILIAPRKAKLLLLSLLSLFIIPNLFQLSVDMFNNHKLFNLFMAIAVIFTANFLSKLKPLFLLLLLFALTFSGVVDFFALKNDHKLSLVPFSEDSKFVLRKFPPKSVILNSTWFYHPASMVGRPIFNGYTYFTWSHGYDSYGREDIVKQIYRSATKFQACTLLRQNAISYVELNDHPEDYLQPNFTLWKNVFLPMYYNSQSGVTFYDISKNCQT